jgi:hypothetical protein
MRVNPTRNRLQRRIDKCLARAREHQTAADAVPDGPIRNYHLNGAAEWEQRAKRLQGLIRRPAREPPAD